MGPQGAPGLGHAPSSVAPFRNRSRAQGGYHCLTPSDCRRPTLKATGAPGPWGVTGAAPQRTLPVPTAASFRSIPQVSAPTHHTPSRSLLLGELHDIPKTLAWERPWPREREEPGSGGPASIGCVTCPHRSAAECPVCQVLGVGRRRWVEGGTGRLCTQGSGH